METSKLQHPMLNVIIGGTAAEERPSSFSLITDQDFPSVVASIKFPAGAVIGQSGDPVMVSLSFDGETHLLFTGEIYAAGIYEQYSVFALTDGYKKLCDTSIIAAYRKENTSVILQDALDKAGIDKTAITCPAVELARFSTENIPADQYIRQIIKALEEHGYTGFRFFFDEENIFRFGTAEDTGKNEGAVYEFTTGKNIIAKERGCIYVLPYPIRHSQEIILDGVNLVTNRTDLIISGSQSKLRLWFKESA